MEQIRREAEEGAVPSSESQLLDTIGTRYRAILLEHICRFPDSCAATYHLALTYEAANCKAFNEALVAGDFSAFLPYLKASSRAFLQAVRLLKLPSTPETLPGPLPQQSYLDHAGQLLRFAGDYDMFMHYRYLLDNDYIDLEMVGPDLIFRSRESGRTPWDLAQAIEELTSSDERRCWDEFEAPRNASPVRMNMGADGPELEVLQEWISSYYLCQLKFMDEETPWLIDDGVTLGSLGTLKDLKRIWCLLGAHMQFLRSLSIDDPSQPPLDSQTFRFFDWIGERHTTYSTHFLPALVLLLDKRYIQAAAVGLGVRREVSTRIMDFCCENIVSEPGVGVYKKPLRLLPWGSDRVLLLPSLWLWTSADSQGLLQFILQWEDHAFQRGVAPQLVRAADYFAELLRKLGFEHVVSNHIVGSPSHPVGDIDLGVFDHESNVLVICEFKTIGVVDLAGMKNEFCTLLDAVSQLKRIRDHIVESDISMLRNAFSCPDLETFPRIERVIVTWRTYYYGSIEGIPVITFERLRTVISKGRKGFVQALTSPISTPDLKAGATTRTMDTYSITYPTWSWGPRR